MYLFDRFYGIKYKKWGGQEILFGVVKIGELLSVFRIAYCMGCFFQLRAGMVPQACPWR